MYTITKEFFKLSHYRNFRHIMDLSYFCEILSMDYLGICFTIPFPMDGGYISVHPEMAPYVQGLTPTGRYFVYYLSITKGSCTFVIEQDAAANWFAETKPSFIGQDMIAWIGEKIEKR